MNLPTSRVALVLSCVALLVAAAARARAEPFEPDVDASYVRSGAFATFAASLVEGVQIDAVRSVDVDGDGDLDRLLDVTSVELGEDACILARRTEAGWTSTVLDRGATGEYLDVRCGEPVRAGDRVFLTTSGYGRETDVSPVVAYHRYQVLVADPGGALWLVHEGTSRNALYTWQLRARDDGGLLLLETRERAPRGTPLLETVRHRTIRWDPATRASSLTRWSRGRPRSSRDARPVT
ncbi:MAG: hypothetical protein IT379_30865 [Deltaproteobacteria bacterium]|nr:hypothetical protein [Deltaproteobacteria bacterium]